MYSLFVLAAVTLPVCGKTAPIPFTELKGFIQQQFGEMPVMTGINQQGHLLTCL